MSLKPRQVDFNKVWGSIQETIYGVITLAPVPRKIWNDRFSDVYSLCVAHPEPMADRLYSETRLYLMNHVAKLLVEVQADGDLFLIKNYYKYWTDYSVGAKYLHNLYLYLNHQHIKTQKMTDAEIIYGTADNTGNEQMEIGELTLEIWRSGMIQPLGPKLVKLLLDAIDVDRQYQSIPYPMDAIRGTILSFVEVQSYKKKGELQLYQELFEESFLDASGEYFKREAARLLENKNVSFYMEKVLGKLEEELLRARKFLHASSLQKITQRCETHMVAEHLAFLYSDCMNMVISESKKDLTNMHTLLKSVPNGMAVLIENVLNHIKSQGLLAINNLPQENMHVNFVENLLKVYKHQKQLIEEFFKGDQNFMGALDKACSYVINYRTNDGRGHCRSPELLAKYCDALLKKSSKGINEAEVDEKLNQSITIFKYIDDKDIFQKFYSRMLAKRLIHQQTYSMDAEEAMINRLKQACGYEFTNKLHRMFTDMSVSNDLNNKFNTFLKQLNVELGISFNVYVLQAGAWPLGQSNVTPFAVPQQLEQALQRFEEFYHKGFNGRKLTWLHNLSQAELRLGYLKKTYYVTMQTFQMAIMLMFEKTNFLSCAEIQDALKLSFDQFQRHACSLLECKLLNSDTEELTQQTILNLNFDYSNKRTKFKINAAIQKETPQETEHTINSVEEDRKLYLHAAIVRIMKSRKVIKHNALIQEICQQSKGSFAPSIQMIKKCIESLMEKQYMERSTTSSDEYNYIA